MNHLPKAGAVIVEPSAKQRSTLKGALFATNLFGKIYQAKDIAECVSLLKEEVTDILIVFLAYDFTSEEKQRLVTAGKNSHAAADSAYVVVYKSAEQDTGTIALNLMDGIDSFVVAPYSVESLVKTSHLAQKLKAERRQTRLEKTVTFLLQDALKILDEIAQKKVDGKSPGKRIRTMKNQKEAIRHLDDELVPFFYELLPKLCEGAEPFLHHESLSSQMRAKKAKETVRSNLGESPTALLNKIKSIRRR